MGRPAGLALGSMLLGLLAAWLMAASLAAGATNTASTGLVSAQVSYEPGSYGAPADLQVTRAGSSWSFAGLADPDGPGQADWAVAGDSLIVRDLDGDGEPEVLVSLYTSGSQCCIRSVVARFIAASGTYELSTQDWGGASWQLAELNGDGVPEFVSWDFRWNFWAVSSAPESARPLRIWTFAQGAFQDTTRNFPGAIRADSAKQWRSYTRSKRGDTRGMLAAYMADAYSLGASTPAWQKVYGAYRLRGRETFFAALRSKLAALGYRGRDEWVPPVTRVPPEAVYVGCNRRARITAKRRPRACVFQDERYLGDAGYNEVRGLGWASWAGSTAGARGVSVGYDYAKDALVRSPVAVRLSRAVRGCDGRLWFSRARVGSIRVHLPTCPGALVSP